MRTTFRSLALSVALLLLSQLPASLAVQSAPPPAPALAPALAPAPAPAPALFTDKDALFSAAQSLQHWWPAYDHTLDLVANRHGALKDGAVYAPGRVGQAFSFDGVKSFVDLGKPPAPNPPTPDKAFTFMLWFRAEEQSGWQYIAFCWDDTGGMDVAINRSQPGDVAVQLGLAFNNMGQGFGQNWNNAVAAFKPADQWHHLAFAYDGHNIRLYLDGTLAKETPWAIYTPSATPLLLGNPDRLTGCNIFKGQMQDVALFGRALTVAEVAAVYQAQTAPVPLTIADAEFQKFDDALAANPAPLAWYAAQRLPSAAAATLAHIAKVAPAAAPEAPAIAALILALDSDSYRERERASSALAAYGSSIAPTLRAALADNPSAEVVNRIQLLLDAMSASTYTPAQVRTARLAAILTRINTPQSKALIDRLPR